MTRESRRPVRIVGPVFGSGSSLDQGKEQIMKDLEGLRRVIAHAYHESQCGSPPSCGNDPRCAGRLDAYPRRDPELDAMVAAVDEFARGREEVVLVDGNALDRVLGEFRTIADRQAEVFRLRFWINDGGIKIKANEMIWSPPYGRIEERRTR